MNKQTETWKEIKGYEGLYQVSTLGRVKKGSFLLKQYSTKGYMFVRLYKDGEYKTKRVHRLVAETFIKNEKDFNEVNHKDENKQNNAVENLEWTTHLANVNYGTRNKRISSAKTNGKQSKAVLQLSRRGDFIKRWCSLSEIQRQLGFNFSNIAQCCRGLRASANGYTWRFENAKSN